MLVTQIGNEELNLNAWNEQNKNMYLIHFFLYVNLNVPDRVSITGRRNVEVPSGGAGNEIHGISVSCMS